MISSGKKLTYEPNDITTTPCWDDCTNCYNSTKENCDVLNFAFEWESICNICMVCNWVSHRVVLFFSNKVLRRDELFRIKYISCTWGQWFWFRYRNSLNSDNVGKQRFCMIKCNVWIRQNKELRIFHKIKPGLFVCRYQSWKKNVIFKVQRVLSLTYNFLNEWLQWWLHVFYLFFRIPQ